MEIIKILYGIETMVKAVFSAVNHIIPKSNIILFNSYPSYSDNARALYEYMLKNENSIFPSKQYQTIWAVDDFSFPEAGKLIREKRIVKKKSLRGIILFLRAKYVFTTHGYFSDVKDGIDQTQINLWHGCGYKDVSENEIKYLGKYTIVTGDIYKKIHARIFRISPDHVFPIGLPRNDYLFSNVDVLKRLGYDRKEYRKIYIWMPTYRQALIRHEGMDGDSGKFGLQTFLETQVEHVNLLLKEKKELLIIKLHPMDVLNASDYSALENILLLKNQELDQLKIHLYELLAQTDVLISDYSSVVVDYLLLDKPIAMITGDLEDYKRNRGFIFDKIEKYLPGPLLESYEAFYEYLQDNETVNEEWKEKRKELKNLFHKYQDDRNCERFINTFLKNKGVGKI